MMHPDNIETFMGSKFFTGIGTSMYRAVFGGPKIDMPQINAFNPRQLAKSSGGANASKALALEIDDLLPVGTAKWPDGKLDLDSTELTELEGKLYDLFGSNAKYYKDALINGDIGETPFRNIVQKIQDTGDLTDSDFDAELDGTKFFTDMKNAEADAKLDTATFQKQMKDLSIDQKSPEFAQRQNMRAAFQNDIQVQKGQKNLNGIGGIDPWEPGTRYSKEDFPKGEDGNHNLGDLANEYVPGRSPPMTFRQLAENDPGELAVLLNHFSRSVEMDMWNTKSLAIFGNISACFTSLRKFEADYQLRYVALVGFAIGAGLIGYYIDRGEGNGAPSGSEEYEQIKELEFQTERLNCLGTCLVKGEDVSSDTTPNFTDPTMLSADGHMNGDVIENQYTESDISDVNIDLSSISPLELNALVSILLESDANIELFFEAFIDASDTFTETIAAFSDPTEQNLKDTLIEFNNTLNDDYVKKHDKIKEVLEDTLVNDKTVGDILAEINFGDISILNDDKTGFNGDMDDRDKESALIIIAFKAVTFTMNTLSTNVNATDSYFSGMCITSDDLNTHFDESEETNCVNYCVSSNVCDIDIDSPGTYVPDPIVDDASSESESDDDDEDGLEIEEVEAILTEAVEVGGRKIPIWLIVCIVLLIVGGGVFIATRKGNSQNKQNFDEF